MKLSSGLLVTILVAAPVRSAEIRIGGVAEAATYMSGLGDYGSLATIFCTGLTGINGIVQPAQYPLPNSLAGVSVLVDGIVAPLLAVADLGPYQQINIQVPVDRTSLTASVAVSQFGQSAQITVEPSLYWSFFFTLPSSPPFFASPGTAAVQHSDYSIVTSEHPARPGEIVIAYGTNPSIRIAVDAPPLGSPSPAFPLAFALPIVASGNEDYWGIWVNGKFPETAFFGLAPGLVGVFQVNFRIPADTPDGDAILVAVQARCSSQPPLTACVYYPSISARVSVQAASSQ